MRLSALSLVLILAFAAGGPVRGQELPSVPGSFSSAKTKAFAIYSDHRKTFYCDCKFDADKQLQSADCGYEPRNDNVRAHRVEWEHVVPASRFGRMRSCWLNRKSFPACRKSNGKFLSGRECCRKVDATFKAMEADLQNLRPAVGELNADRSDNPYGEIEGEDRVYGDCDFEVQGGVAEPKKKRRGDIARTDKPGQFKRLDLHAAPERLDDGVIKAIANRAHRGKR